MSIVHQVKIFSGYNRAALEKETNKWLRDNAHVAIFDIAYTNNRSGGEQTIFITYDPMENEEDD